MRFCNFKTNRTHHEKILLGGTWLCDWLLTVNASDYCSGEAYIKQSDYDQPIIFLKLVEVKDVNYLNSRNKCNANRDSRSF